MSHTLFDTLSHTRTHTHPHRSTPSPDDDRSSFGPSESRLSEGRHPGVVRGRADPGSVGDLRLGVDSIIIIIIIILIIITTTITTLTIIVTTYYYYYCYCCYFQ